MKIYNKPGTKERLFEMMKNVNKITLKEEWGDSYQHDAPKKPKFNPLDIREVKEIWTYLMNEGIPDVRDHYPSWVVEYLVNNDYIQESNNFNWLFTESGRQQFETPNDLQEVLIPEGGFNVDGVNNPYGKNDNSSEVPYLRGREIDEDSASEYEYLVADNDFNKAHYPEMIGKTFDSPPGYVAVSKVKKNSWDNKSNLRAHSNYTGGVETDMNGNIEIDEESMNIIDSIGDEKGSVTASASPITQMGKRGKDNKNLVRNAYDSVIIQRGASYKPTAQDINDEIRKMNTAGEIYEMSTLRKTSGINRDKHKYVAVHLWDSLISGVKIVLFSRDMMGSGWKLFKGEHLGKTPYLFVKEDFLGRPDVAYLQGKAGQEFLTQEGYKIKQDTKTIVPVNGTEKPLDVNTMPVDGSNSANIEESTDMDKYENVVFMQGDEAYEPLELLDRKGEDAALNYLKQWHNFGQHEGSSELGLGTNDQKYEKDGYIMSWNPRIGYIGLQYDLNYTDGQPMDELSEEEIPSGNVRQACSNGLEQSKTTGKPDKIGFNSTDNPKDFTSRGSMRVACSNGLKIKEEDEMPDEGMFVDKNSPGYVKDFDSSSDQPESDDQIPGGIGDDAGESKFSGEQIRKGIAVEMEHTDDPMTALDIVFDHLTEDPMYYGDETQDPEQAAQCGAQKDTDDADILLGFKPANIGDEPQINEISEGISTGWDKNSISEFMEIIGQDDRVDFSSDQQRGLSDGDFGRIMFDIKNNTLYLKFETPEEAKIAQERLSNTLSNPYEFSSRFDIMPSVVMVQLTDDGEGIDESKESEIKSKNPALWHQIQIAKKTLKMNDAMLGVMGGMTKEEAKNILSQNGIGGGIDEYFGQKFLTGHANGELETAKAKIIKDIDDSIAQMQKHPDLCALTGGTLERSKEGLLQQAETNNWKGSVVAIKSRADGMVHLIYKEGSSGLQKLGGAAASGYK